MPTRALTDFVIKHRAIVLGFFFLFILAAATQLPRVTIDPSMKSQFPEDMPSRLNIDRIEHLFGGTEFVMVMVLADDVTAPATLRRVRDLSRAIERLDQVERVLSLFTLKDIRGEDGAMVVDPAVPALPTTPEEQTKLMADLSANDLLYGNVVAKDFTATAILAQVGDKTDDYRLIAAIEAVIDANPGPELVRLGGMPWVRANIATDIQHDLRTFLPIGILIMLAFLYFCFRHWRGVVLPFLVVIIAIIVGLALVPLFGWKIQIVTILLPVILIAVANDYSIHLLTKYDEYHTASAGHSATSLVSAITGDLAAPTLICGLTTIGGLLCLMTHVIIPAKQLSILASLGIAFALLASLTFLPALLLYLPLPTPSSTARSGWLDRILLFLAGLVTGKARTTLLILLVSTIAVAAGIPKIVVESNPDGYYALDHPVRQSSSLANRNFGGSSSVAVIAEGDILQPEVLQKIDRLENALAQRPEVGTTSSISRVVRRMNKVMHDGLPEEDRLPDSRDAVAQYFLLYSMNGDPEDFERMVDFDFSHALVSARIRETSSNASTRVMTFVRDWIKTEGSGLFVVAGGFTDLFAELVEAIVSGQMSSLFLSLLVVTLLVALLFRSATAGLIAGLPLGFSMALLFGSMGYLNIELNVATALLSSIMIGVGVDYTIHFLWRYREERARELEPVEAAEKTLVTTGRGIVFNALSVIVGFFVLMLSAFLPIRFFGFLVVVSIGTCLIGALVLVPALCIVFRPKFLEPGPRGSTR